MLTADYHKSLAKSNDQYGGTSAATYGKEGGQLSKRSLMGSLRSYDSNSPRQRSSSFIKTNLQEGYITGK